MNRLHILFSLVLAPSALGCAAHVEETSSEDIGVAEQAIINGTPVTSNTLSAIAIYHQVKNANGTWQWFVRPCSGRVLNPNNPPEFKILTARHCVTEHGTISGDLLDPSRIRLTAAVNPGIASPNPPSYAVTAWSVNAMNATGDDDSKRDIAVVGAFAYDLGLPANVHHVGLNLASTAVLANDERVVMELGYGWGAENNDNTAGRLRRAHHFEIIGSNMDGKYLLRNSGNGNTSITHGDSGGPTILKEIAVGQSGSSVAYQQLGVHSSIGTDGTATDASIAENWDWVQIQVRTMYLRTLAHRDRRVTVNSLNSQEPVHTAPNGSTAGHAWLKYTSSDKHIRVLRIVSEDSGLCLDLKNNVSVAGQPLWLYSCNRFSPAQAFVMTKTYHIRLEAHSQDGLCVTETQTGAVVLDVCNLNRADQIWIWDRDPGVYPYSPPED